ncbi:lysophospholipid acyltransferase family protein [Pseudonocardia petroleophila]|uniref:1-acyl-sn-glycerol-3-phosphate acyltransferase n=1 Tax=Pseudonocardia petroleophila TaxID=37331 RepID=A0A7G7MQ86_9PSEU|nr:lysophospholipid acyltransferase family protein [Pseudonocardia petroleophila]QNG54947.1 1-acyl-sn-glycerol-3-phosphate acyltransferase [Pseudonocardia petroleophila]
MTPASRALPVRGSRFPGPRVAGPAGGAVHDGAAPAAWVPAPVCTPSCLPPAEGSVGVLRFAARLGALVAVLGAAVTGVAVLRGRARQAWLRTCATGALRAAGVRLVVTGADGRRPAGGATATRGGGVLVVANHLSWIDVLALFATAPVRLQAKCEVRDWPVIGPLAARTGALFVDRAGLRDLPRTVSGTADALRAGAVVGVFPEGTTWCGAAGGTFRRAAFQAAIDAGAPVRPVALVLRRADGGPGTAGAFVGDQTLWDSLRRTLRTPGLTCELTVLPDLDPAGADRRTLAAAAAAAVGSVTGVAHLAPARRRRIPVAA